VGFDLNEFFNPTPHHDNWKEEWMAQFNSLFAQLNKDNERRHRETMVASIAGRLITVKERYYSDEVVASVTLAEEIVKCLQTPKSERK
jgi:hypothetical protein